jgi:hypothetical protein
LPVCGSGTSRIIAQRPGDRSRECQLIVIARNVDVIVEFREDTDVRAALKVELVATDRASLA